MHHSATKFSSTEPKFNFPTLFGAGKALGSAPQQGVTGTQQGGQSEKLGQWLEDARSYYNSVMSGATQRPSAQEWNQFLQWMNWASSQAGSGGSWDPMGGAQGSMSQGPALPPGSHPGPMGNAVFNSEKAATSYQPSGMPIDVLSDEFTLNVGVKVQDVSVEKTTDNRLNPPSDVIKIIVHDKFSVPSETVYFVQPDAKININTVGGKGVTQSGTETLKNKDGTPQIVVGSFSAGAQGAEGADSSLPGVQDKLDKNTWTYKPEVDGDTVDFRANPGSGNQNHIVYANANISVHPGDNVNVQRIPNAGGFDIQVKVTHEDGTSDTYTVKKGYKAQVNANLEYVTIDGKSYDGKTIPAEYGGKLGIAGPGTPGPAAPPLVGTLIVSDMVDKKHVWETIKP